MKTKLLYSLLALSTVVQTLFGATITVNTTNNVTPGAGQTSLVMALQNAQAGDTIAFNIPGDGPHFIKTPEAGYPWIINDNITIDGYSQPGSAANSNPIHATNNARIKIVLDSREGGRTVMNYITGRPGYGDGENAILGVFNAANVTIKGLGFLGLQTGNSDADPAIYCIAFARDHAGAPNFDDNGHISGCWFGVEPNGTSITGGSAAAVTAFRHRDISGGSLPELPNKNLTIGVKAGSTNPRAEFNVIVGMSYAVAGEQTGARFSGNFLNVLPDGHTPYDQTIENAAFYPGALLEIGRYNDSTILVGTDGDGVNDAEEGNVFGPLSGGEVILGFYGTGNKTFIIAGNYFGVAVDGVTAFPGSFQIFGSGFNGANVRFGSDFDGVSDALEGNLVVNNHPFAAENPVINPIEASAGAKLSVRGNSLVNNYPLPVNVAGAILGLNNPSPDTFYTGQIVATDPVVIQPVIASAGAQLVGTSPVGAAPYTATIIDLYEADPEGIINGKTLNIEGLTNGFVQGKRYIKSFVDNSPADLNPTAGAFSFDISALPINGQTVTITANYSVEAPGAHNAQVLTSPFSEPVVATVGPRTLTVTTTNNVTPGAGQTSLVMALQNAQAGDTIAFNIPGDGPHFIKTPEAGYPWIINDNITIDGYSQPGSAANSNPIHATNNARIKIVLDSREGGRTVMNYITGRPGYGDGENAILGVFNAANVTIKGLGFLGLQTGNSDADPAIYCIAFARDHAGAPNFDDNGHISGCWFGVEPNGTSITGGSAAAVTAFRHRDISGGSLPELPNKNLTIGVKAGSTNPRAEFNVIVGMSYAVAGEQTGARFSGNFLNVLPDGHTPYDQTIENAAFYPGALLEIGRYNDSTILIGTDGDGVNDAEEGNVFGPLSGGEVILGFYGTGNKTFIIAGNYFGVAVDGVTAFPGSFQIFGSGFNASNVRFGSDFDGVSDALEGNLVVNNHPFAAENPVINPIEASAGAKLSVRGNSLVNNYPLPVNVAGAILGLNNPSPDTFYTGQIVATDPVVIQPVIASAGAQLVGTSPVGAAPYTATIIDLYEADPEGIINGKTLNIEGLTNGFVQGKRYIKSFVDNSPADLNPAAGAFSFDISALPINGQTVTITANYSVEAPGTHNAQALTSPFSEPVVVGAAPEEFKITVTATATSLTISWPSTFTGVTVESKTDLNTAAWSPVNGVVGNSVTVPIQVGSNQFFRLKR